MRDTSTVSHIDFRVLSIPELQPAPCAKFSWDDEVIPRGGSSGSEKVAVLDGDTYVPVNYICSEACAFLAAAEASAARRVTAKELDVSNNGLTLKSSSEAPPKKFPRTFWKSIALRLLYRGTSTAESGSAAITRKGESIEN